MKKPTPGKRPLRKNKFPRNLETYPCRNNSLVNLTGESWKPIEGLEDYYEISNFGRVKALAREIIYPNGKVIHKKLKINMAGISAAPNYYTGDYTYQLGITIYLENKKFRFTISRLVYHHFVQPFDLENKEMFILQKDGNGLNCHYQNLYMANANSKQKRIYKRDRSVSCFGWLDMKEIVKKDLKRRMKPVTQYTDKGKRVRTFESY